MNRPSSAREALIAEAIGEVGQLLDRLEALTPAIDSSREALSLSTSRLGTDILAYERRMNAINERVKTEAAHRIAAHIGELARTSQVEQVQFMQEAARGIFDREISPVLHRLISSLEPVAHKLNHPWTNWLTHAATAAVAATLTMGLMLCFFASAPQADGQAAVASGCNGCCGDSARALRLR